MLIEKIKTDQLIARKGHDAIASSLLTTLIGEAEMVGKNAGRAVTDEEVVAVVKKFVKNMDETLGYLGDVDSNARTNVLIEKNVITKYLPQQLNALQLEKIIGNLVHANGKNTGAIMKELKAKFAGQYDGKMASEIVKKVLAG